MDNDLTQRTATEMVALLRADEVPPHDALDAAESRIGLVEGIVNALPIQFLDAACPAADGWRRPADGDAAKLLAGLPVAVNNYNDAGGQITSHGSPVFAENRPARDDATVQRLRATGGIPYAKSNVPEIAGVGLADEDVEASAGAYLGDTCAHLAGSDDAHLMNCGRGRAPVRGERMDWVRRPQL